VVLAAQSRKLAVMQKSGEVSCFNGLSNIQQTVVRLKSCLSLTFNSLIKHALKRQIVLVHIWFKKEPRKKAR